MWETLNDNRIHCSDIDLRNYIEPKKVLVLGIKKWRMRLTFELTTTELVFWIHLQKAMLTGRATSVCTKHSLCTSKYV